MRALGGGATSASPPSLSLRSSLSLPATAGSGKRRCRHSPRGRDASSRRPVKPLLLPPASRRRHVPGAPRMPGSGTGGAGPPPHPCPPSARRGGGDTARSCETRGHLETPASPHSRHHRTRRHLRAPPASPHGRHPLTTAIPAAPRHSRAPPASPHAGHPCAPPASPRRRCPRAVPGPAARGSGLAGAAAPRDRDRLVRGEHEPLAGVCVGDFGVSNERLEKA